jgi:hypothetical protein
VHPYGVKSKLGPTGRTLYFIRFTKASYYQ